MGQLNKKRSLKGQKSFSSISYKAKRKMAQTKSKSSRTKTHYLKEEERLFLLEDIQERSIYELRELQEEELSQQEVALYYSFLNQIEEEIQKQQDLVIEVRQELEETEDQTLPHFHKRYRYRI